MKKFLALLLTFVTAIIFTTGYSSNLASDSTSNYNQFIREEHLAPITMQFGCVNPAFDYFAPTKNIDISHIPKETASNNIVNEVYDIFDDLCTYLLSKYHINAKINEQVPIYVVTDLASELSLSNVCGLYDDATDAIYLDKNFMSLGRTYYYRLVAHELCHMLQVHLSKNASGTECMLRNSQNFVLGYRISEGIAEKTACELAAWKNKSYDSEPAGYIDEFYAVKMLEISIPNLINYYFNFNVNSFQTEVCNLISENTTYNSNISHVTAFEHLLCHIDMCGLYRNLAYSGDPNGWVYIYSAQAIIEMSCSMSRNLVDSKKAELWQIIEEYDNSCFVGSMLRDYSDIFKTALY